MYQTIVDGHIGGDAEKRVSKNGREYVTFRMAHNEKDREGNKQTIWFTVVSWNHTGLTPYLTKGKAIEVIGKQSCRLYQTKDNKTEIGYDLVANAIDFVYSGNGDNDDSKAKTTTNTNAEVPVTQVKMAKPTTAEITLPDEPVGDSEDDLPF